MLVILVLLLRLEPPFPPLPPPRFNRSSLGAPPPPPPRTCAAPHSTATVSGAGLEGTRLHAALGGVGVCVGGVLSLLLHSDIWLTSGAV